jgi:molybdenum cofactor cytidylyltransferase
VIVAIILAAGNSSRMGKPKPLMKIGKHSFIRTVVDVYNRSHVQKIVVVTQPNAVKIEEELSGHNVFIVPNPNHERGQLSSIIAGIDAAEKYHPDAILVHPVDHPVINESVINALIDLYYKKIPLIVVPKYRGKKGHPVLFSGKLFGEIRNAPLDVGARDVVWRHIKDTTELEVDEKGVVLDIDTPKDYEDLQRTL